MFYEDKVSIGGGSPHGFNAAVMTSGNFSLSQTNRDISKAVQSLPGVQSSVAFRNDLIIRGGAPNENRFFLG
jgi:hypothetical protein